MNIVLLLIILCCTCGRLASQETWQMLLEGSGIDGASCIVATIDGGYIAAGYTWSVDGDYMGTRVNGPGMHDIFITKIDAHGRREWLQRYGGKGYDYCTSIIPIADSGYLLIGATMSIDGDFTSMAKGGYDIYIMKIDLLGTIISTSTYGGVGNDIPYSAIATADGGVIMTGATTSNDGDFEGMNHGKSDAFVIKYDRSRSVQWKRLVGGYERDINGYEIEKSTSIITTRDGGFVITGCTCSNDGDFLGMNKGLGDTFVMKFDSIGNTVWVRTFGGKNWELGTGGQPVSYLAAAPNGGIILVGTTGSADGDFQGLTKGGYDVFIIKLNDDGKKQWIKVIGGVGSHDYASGLITYQNGDIILSGFQDSGGGYKYDIYFMKFDSSGNVLWNTAYLGRNDDLCSSISHAHDQGFVITGSTDSYDGDMASIPRKMPAYSHDAIIAKFNSSGRIQGPTAVEDNLSSKPSVEVVPNPVSTTATIAFSVEAPSHVTIELFSSTGESVETLYDGNPESGTYHVSFNAASVSSGIYTVRMSTDNGVTSAQMCIVQ